MLLIMLLPGLGIIRIRYNGYNLSPQKPPPTPSVNMECNCIRHPRKSRAKLTKKEARSLSPPHKIILT